MSTNFKLKAFKIIGQRKAFYRQRIPGSSYARKETVDIDILVTSRNGDRKILQSIWITSRPTLRKRKWNQLSQSSTKVISIEKTWAGYISTMSQRFKRSCKNIAKTCCFEYFWHAWLWPPKTMVSASRKLWLLSSSKKLNLCLTSFFPRFCNFVTLSTLGMSGHPHQNNSIFL